MTTLPLFTPTYDANGNTLTDSLHTYTWDAGNRPYSVDVTSSCGSSGVCITYDALGRMVEKNVSGTYTEFLYGPGGSKLATMNGQTVLTAFNGNAIYSGSTLSYWRHLDWLGSARFGSTTNRTMQYSLAYAPFGATYAEAGTVDRSLTGHDQDTVTGSLSGDYDTPTRKLAQYGRWISPDPAGLRAVDLSNPQSLNRYAYVSNDPLDRTDSTGMFQRFNSYVESDGGWLAFHNFGLNCTVDGAPTPCGMLGGMVQADVVADCPQCQPGQRVGIDNVIYAWQFGKIASWQFDVGPNPVTDEEMFIDIDFWGYSLNQVGTIATTLVTNSLNVLSPNQLLNNSKTISPPKQWKPAPSTFWKNYGTQLGCEASVMIADISDQEDYFKGSSVVLAAGWVGNSLTVGLAGDALIGAAVIGDAFHARGICVPLAWGH